jgi:hypothetical protein
MNLTVCSGRNTLTMSLTVQLRQRKRLSFD